MIKVSIPRPGYGKPQPDVGVTLTPAGVAPNECEHREYLTRDLHRTPSIRAASDTNLSRNGFGTVHAATEATARYPETLIDGENRDRTTNDVQDC
jgi:hypothetical protein